jgi:hypothetical protein
MGPADDAMANETDIQALKTESPTVTVEEVVEAEAEVQVEDAVKDAVKDVVEDEEVVTRSPRTHIDSAPLPTDSMVTVPLSEGSTTPDEASVRGSVSQPQIVVHPRRDSSRPSSTEILKAFGRRSSVAASEQEAESPGARKSRARARRQSDGSGRSEPVDWAELEKKEEQEPEGAGQDKVSSGPATDAVGAT